jgi:hypothetical protein
MRYFSLLLTSYLLLHLPVLGGTLHVFPDGTGLFPTIQSAIDAATLMDTVLLAPGVYTGVGNRKLDFGGKDITLRGEGDPEVTILDCEYLDIGMTFFSGAVSTCKCNTA